MASPNQITVKQLGRLIGTPQAPVLVDLRVPEDFDEDPRLIPGALRHPFREAEALANVAAGQTMVVYCQKGLKISEGAAAILRTAGRMALALEGGQFAWRDAGLP
ncbi:MAG: sulfurtransferase, partial [Alphaproteobacteria bacterium]|nr:sulfurtransferase [Alphaproteobacteria bacterium]